MNEIYISLKNELKLFINLYKLLSSINFYFDNIYIICDNKYLSFNYELFFNLYNVHLIQKPDISIKSIIYEYINNNNFIENINCSNINTQLKLNIEINRNIEQENIHYKKLIHNINKDYIFYYNNSNRNIINYFDNKYIFNPLKNFYNNYHEKYDLWIDLDIKTISYYLKIIENSLEIHIYDIDLLYLLLEIDLDHIDNKYFYYNDIMIKEQDDRLKNWSIIFIDDK
jgi:hypothetical protein